MSYRQQAEEARTDKLAVRILGFFGCVFSHFLSVLCMLLFYFNLHVGSLFIVFNFTLSGMKSRYRFELLFNMSYVSICY